MAGFVYVFTGPTDFAVGFVVSEIVARLSVTSREGLRMVKKALEMRSRSFVECFKAHAIAFWEAHLPSRHSLLMSSCKPSEKVQRIAGPENGISFTSRRRESEPGLPPIPRTV
jgi:hypothetical protein